MDLTAFEVVQETKRIKFFLIWNAIVPHQREGDHKNLTGIGRIGQGLRVSHHSGGEANLSRGAAWMAEGPAVEHTSISKLKASRTAVSKPRKERFTGLCLVDMSHIRNTD